MTDPHYDRRKAVFNEVQVRQIRDLITDEMDAIAEAAADKAIEKLTGQAYRAVGKTVVDKFLWIVGVLTLGLLAWANGKGYLTWK